jgi:uncharacterized protein YjaG (DUF416 family)
MRLFKMEKLNYVYMVEIFRDLGDIYRQILNFVFWEELTVKA